MPVGNLLEKNMGKICGASLKSLKKGLRSGVGSIYVVRGADPDPHQNVTDPQLCMVGGWVADLVPDSSHACYRQHSRFESVHPSGIINGRHK